MIMLQLHVFIDLIINNFAFFDLAELCFFDLVYINIIEIIVMV